MNNLISYSKKVQFCVLNLNVRGELAIDFDDVIIIFSDEGRIFIIIVKINCIDRSMIIMQYMVYFGKLKKEFILCYVVSVYGELQD